MFKFSLNTSTISGQKLSLEQQIETVAKAGYDAIEPWMRDVEHYIKSGKSLAELKKRIADLGLSVEDAIGFAQWIVDDEAVRKKGMEQLKHDMELVAQIGGKRLAAPPLGATDIASFDLKKAAERYAAVLDLGEKMGIVPQLEFWGHSKTIGRLSEAAQVARDAGRPKACILADVFHMYKGGSDFADLGKLPKGMLQVMHVNDYPADPPRAKIADRDRVWPGDGIAPLTQILRDVAANNPRCVLSLELFNAQYWKLDALVAARTGLEKMKAAVKKAEL